MSHHRVLAILLAEGRYILQLRDNKPEITAPGMWGLFGGGVNPGESPDEAIQREIEEELCICPTGVRFLWNFQTEGDHIAPPGHYWVYEADITNLWGHHRLTEGQDAAHFSFIECKFLNTPQLIRSVLERYEHEIARAHCIDDHE
mgnify:CR=1 FL=1